MWVLLCMLRGDLAVSSPSRVVIHIREDSTAAKLRSFEFVGRAVQSCTGSAYVHLKWQVLAAAQTGSWPWEGPLHLPQ